MMQCTTHPDNLLNQFITSFGYSDADRANLTALTPDQNSGRGWVEVPTAVENPLSGGRWPKDEICELDVQNNGSVRQLRFSFPAAEKVQRATVCSLDGRIVATLLELSSRRFSWSGLTANGSKAGRGQYYLHLVGNRTSRSFQLSLL
jgi:hypothetical protein